MSHETLTSDPVAIKRAIETLPGRYGFAEDEIAKHDLSRAYYLIEQGGSNQITAKFYDTHGDLIAGFTGYLIAEVKVPTCEPIVSSDDPMTRYCKSLAHDAIIDTEFGTQLGDANLIDAICESEGKPRKWFDALPEIEKRILQVGWVAPPFCLY